jgi:hypothetical protein
VKHLGGYYDRLFACAALADDILLQKRDSLCRYLHAKVSPRNHDSVAVRQYLVKVIDSLLVLNLGYYLQVAFVLVENLLYLNEILLGAHE